MNLKNYFRTAAFAIVMLVSAAGMSIGSMSSASATDDGDGMLGRHNNGLLTEQARFNGRLNLGNNGTGASESLTRLELKTERAVKYDTQPESRVINSRAVEARVLTLGATECTGNCDAAVHSRFNGKLRLTMPASDRSQHHND